MLLNHSGQHYTLAMAAKYKMIDFQNIKYNKQLACTYSIGEDSSFKKYFIDSEISNCFRFEKWIDNIYYSIEVPLIAYSIYFKKERINSFNVNCKLVVMNNNEYEEYLVSINDPYNFKTKDGAWNQSYVLNYGKQVFDYYKEEIINMITNNIFDSRYVRIYKQRFITESF